MTPHPVADELVPAQRPTALELHSGILVGRQSHRLPEPRWTRWRPEVVDARAVFERVVRDQLVSGPTAVEFSGGRDSSLVLAVATHVARRHGLTPPRAISVRYPGHASVDEAMWQELVTAHLDVPLEVVEVESGGDDLAGPVALARLRRDGPVVPPPAGVVVGRVARAAPGYRVLTGEGGDSVLQMQRISYWAAHLRRRRVPTRELASVMAHDLLPGPLRRARHRRSDLAAARVTWLRPAARRALAATLAREATAEPWDWRRATWSILDQRMIVAGLPVMAEVARREGVTLAHPLLEPRFVEALGRAAGGAGLTNRTEAMRLLGADLLPEALLARRTKASFNGVYSGTATRAFARGWDGSGVDLSLVDPDELRRVWQLDEVPNAALAPLQLALHASLPRGHDDAATAFAATA